MKRHSSSRSGAPALLLLTVTTLLGVAALLRAAAPGWWTTQGVSTSTPAADYAAISQGQLKTLARAAMAEMEQRLAGGAGPGVHSLVDPWVNPSGGGNPLDYAAVNIGQLKTVVAPFYTRLNLPFPWTGSSSPPMDFAMANIGQAKTLFAFQIVPNVALDSDGDGLTDEQEAIYGTRPDKADTDEDGLNDGEEVARGTDPLDDDSDDDGAKDGEDDYPLDARLSRDLPIVHYARINVAPLISGDRGIEALTLDADSTRLTAVWTEPTYANNFEFYVAGWVPGFPAIVYGTFPTRVLSAPAWADFELTGVAEDGSVAGDAWVRVYNPQMDPDYVETCSANFLWTPATGDPDPRIPADPFENQMVTGRTGGITNGGIAYGINGIDYPFSYYPHYFVGGDVFPSEDAAVTFDPRVGGGEVVGGLNDTGEPCLWRPDGLPLLNLQQLIIDSAPPPTSSELLSGTLLAVNSKRGGAGLQAVAYLAVSSVPFGTPEPSTKWTRLLYKDGTLRDLYELLPASQRKQILFSDSLNSAAINNRGDILVSAQLADGSVPGELRWRSAKVLVTIHSTSATVQEVQAPGGIGVPQDGRGFNAEHLIVDHGLRLPVDKVAVFGFGGEPGKAVTKAYLEGAATAKSGNVYMVKGKDPAGADKTYAILLGDTQAELQQGLSAVGCSVVFDGHSNMGMGPAFDPAEIKRLSDFTNIGNPKTAINWPYLVQDEYSGLTTIAASEIAGNTTSRTSILPTSYATQIQTASA